MNQFLSTFTSGLFSYVSVLYRSDKRMHYYHKYLLYVMFVISMRESNQEPRFFPNVWGFHQRRQP